MIPHVMKNSTSILFLGSFLVPALAGKFSLPITKVGKALPGIIPSFPNQYGGTQRSLSSESKPSFHAPITNPNSQSRGFPIDFQAVFISTTNISVGTPPQSFLAIVDLNWSDLFLPSSTCGSPSAKWCTPSNATYNASASSTYHDNGTITQVSYGPVSAYARLSEDILTLTDGLQVPGQVFHEIKYYEDVYDYVEAYFDGVLGLSVDKPWMPGGWGPQNSLPSPFRSMIDNHLLDSNMFSIVWPSDARGQGNLIFGGYDEDLLDGELVSHPLSPANTTEWKVEIDSVSMIGDNDCGGKKVLLHTRLPPQSKAFLMSLFPSIAFSYNLAESLLSHINNWPSACVHLRGVDCNEIPSLPEIVIGLKGQNVTLRGEDYALKLQMPKSCQVEMEECFLMIDYLGDAEDLVILGMPFLQKVMGIYNWDEKTVSFGELKE